MRATLWMLTVLAIFMAALSAASTWLCQDSARTFGQEAATMQFHLDQGDWQGLQKTLEHVSARWEARESALQMMISHRETDDVSTALNKLQAGIAAQDQSLCRWALAEFAESCRHLYHQDALTLTNII